MKIKITDNFSGAKFYDRYIGQVFEVGHLQPNTIKIKMETSSGDIRDVVWSFGEYEIVEDSDPLARLKELVSELPNDWSYSENNLLISAIVEELSRLKKEGLL